MIDILKDKVILVTGGTGSFGQKFVEIVLKRHKPKKLIIFSRDEMKQYEMQKRFNQENLRYFIGDVRDPDRLHRAFEGVDIIVHAAALKIVPTAEYNPFEAVKTNILGVENIINAAIDHNIEKVMAISSDKAVNPVNLYGATKMCMEKLFIAANAYTGKHVTRMSCARYGNVVGSRGSIVPLFKKQAKTGTITVTDERMTRFWITLEQGVTFVIACIENMYGGEVFVPKIPSMKIIDLAKAVGHGCKIKKIGIRPGEKIHECLLTEDETRHAMEFKDFFVVEPEHYWWKKKGHLKNGKRLPDGFRYSSDTNDQWLTGKDILEMIDED